MMGHPVVFFISVGNWSPTNVRPLVRKLKKTSFQSSNAYDNVSQPETVSIGGEQNDVIQMREVSLRHERLQV